MSLKDFLWGTKEQMQPTDKDKPKYQGETAQRIEVTEYETGYGINARYYDMIQKEPTNEYLPEEQKGEKIKRDFISIKKPINKDVIVLVIENSSDTRNYKDRILRLARKIIESNKTCFFLLMKIGDDKKIYDVLDYDALDKETILGNWFKETEASTCDYLEAITCIQEHYKEFILGYEHKAINDQEAKKYSIQNVNIMFVGSGNIPLDAQSKMQCTKAINELKNKTRVKSIKYFCMLDNQTVNAAKLGFPVIGHIETDFYK